ncbi:hypothetical protein N9L02_00965 [Gammaproteobacteria bacterium]|nr:hypothetical protein [Gammaproteobacteria bacterium]
MKNFPTDIENIILDYTSSENFDSRNYNLYDSKYSIFEKRLPVYTLLMHVIKSEKEQAHKMLQKNPLLLLERDTVIDYAGRKHFNRTVYQIALGLMDFDLRLNEEKPLTGMIDIIKNHFKRLPNKNTHEIKKIMQAQQDEQINAASHQAELNRRKNDESELLKIVDLIKGASYFEIVSTSKVSSDILVRSNMENVYNFSYSLSQIVSAILSSSTDDTFDYSFEKLKSFLINKGLLDDSEFNFTLLKGLYKFRNYLEPKNVLTIGKHFNYFLLSDAAEIFCANQGLFGGRVNTPRNSFFWQNIFGYIQRFIPVCDLKFFSERLFKNDNVCKVGSNQHVTFEKNIFDHNINVSGYSPGYNCAIVGSSYYYVCPNKSIDLMNKYMSFVILKLSTFESALEIKSDKKICSIL